MSCGTETLDLRESQRLRMLDHHLSQMTRTHANWVEITEPNAAAQGVWQGVGWLGRLWLSIRCSLAILDPMTASRVGRYLA